MVCPKCKAPENDVNAVKCSKCSTLLLRPITKNKDGSLRLIKGFHTSSYSRMYPDKPAATITTASGHFSSDNTIHPWQNRVLSPLECAKLQTFPESFNWGRALKRWGPTNVRAMIGEAVPPGFTYQHGQAL